MYGRRGLEGRDRPYSFSGGGSGAGGTVIRAGKFYGELGDFFVDRVFRAGFAVLPGAEVQAAAERCKAGQGAGGVGDAGALAGGSVEGEGGVLLPREDGGRQPGEAGAGAHFQEDAQAGGMHLFYHRREFHWGSQLPGQNFAHAVCRLGVSRSGLIRVNAGPGLVEFHLAQRRGELFLRPGYERAVESGRDLEGRILDRALSEALGGPLYLLGAAGQYELRRGVLVGDNEVELLFLHDLLYIRKGGLHRQHAPAVANALRHQGAAQF